MPTKLQSELDRFKQNKGNINIDYRSPSISTPHILDTSFTKAEDLITTIEADIAPFDVPSSHISGDTSNYRNLPVDLLVKNVGEYQSNVVVLNTESTLIQVFYSKTVAVRVGAGNTLVHYYTPYHTLTNTSDPLLPVYFRRERKTEGIIDTKVCEYLYYDSFPNTLSVSYDNTFIKLVQSSETNNGHNIEIDPDSVSESIRRITLFKQDSSNNKSTTKLRLVSGVDSNSSTSESTPLSDLVPNFNLYFNTVGEITPSPDGICFSLKEDESVYLNTLIQSDSTSYIEKTPLGLESFLMTEGYTGGLDSYFLSVKFNFPSIKPTNEFLEDIPLLMVINNEVTKLPSYISSQFDEFCDSIIPKLESKGMKVYKRQDSTLLIYNIGDDVELVFGYKQFSMITVEDVSLTSSIYSQPDLVYTEQGYPPNLSLSYAEDLDIDGIVVDGDIDLSFFCIKLTKNIDKLPIDGLFDFTKYSVDISELKTSPSNIVTEEGGVEKITTLNYVGTSLTDSQILTDIEGKLNTSLINVQVTVEESKLKFRNKLPTYLEFKISSEVLEIVLEYAGLYTKESDKDIYFLKGVI